jgi:hypothetical protein
MQAKNNKPAKASKKPVKTCSGPLLFLVEVSGVNVAGVWPDVDEVIRIIRMHKRTGIYLIYFSKPGAICGKYLMYQIAMRPLAAFGLCEFFAEIDQCVKNSFSL